MIDPGHGGDDVGARGEGGTVEKDLTLAVARRVKAAIEARLGLRVLLTREDDRNVPLDQRIALANNNKADLFISLHANASLVPTASGASIYVAAFEDQKQTQATLTPERGAGVRRRFQRHRAACCGTSRRSGTSNSPPSCRASSRRRFASAAPSKCGRSSAHRFACSSRRTCRPS